MALSPREGRIVCFGEMLARLSTGSGDRGLAFADRLDLHVGGAEANVAVALASLGHDTTMVAALPSGSLGERGVTHLRSFGVDTRHIVRAPGRLGLYFVESGASLRPSQVIYDRADSLFARKDWSAFDWRPVLEGAALFHVSGIALAVSATSRHAAIRAMTIARERGVPVSFDGNFRALLWTGREAESGSAVAAALALADIAFVDHRDATLALGRDVSAGVGSEALFAAFPRLGMIAHTTRRMDSVEVHHLSARVALRDGTDAVTAERHIAGVVDRIGGGDAFAAGVLHARLAGQGAAGMAATGLAAACLKHGQRGDALAVSSPLLAGFGAEGFDVRR